MTGHQDHPGTGKTLMGKTTTAASIEEIARACGMKRIRVVNPYDVKQMNQVLQEELYCGEPSLIISRAPCVLKERTAVKPPLTVDPSKCKNCKACLKLGCPALETPDRESKPAINALTCTGCGLCEQVCRFGAIGK